MPDELRIMFAAGGTGGHVFPAIAIADAIRNLHPGSRFLFVGTKDRMEWETVPAAGYDIVPVWISGFHRRLTLKNLLFPVKLMVSLWQSRQHIRRFQPHALISCGGFVAGPAGWMAKRMSVPIFIQEQNSFPGVTNRKLASGAEQIFTAFDEASNWFPSGKVKCVGNPVRRSLHEQVHDPQFIADSFEHFRLDATRPVVLVMGGSGGAKSINDAVLYHLPELHDREGLQIIWQCGAHYYDEIVNHPGLGPAGSDDGPAVNVRADESDPAEKWDGENKSTINRNTLEERYPGLRLYRFMDDVARAWAVADIVVSRAGAITCSELLVTGKPGILVPSPWVAGDHQTHNARSLADKGAAVFLHDKDLTGRLSGTIRALIRNTTRRNQMSEQALKMAENDAASIIAKKILEFLYQRQKDLNSGNSQNSHKQQIRALA